MPKVAIYCRLSDEDKDKYRKGESESIQNQKNMLLNYAINSNWDIYKIYSDDDYSGLDDERPEFRSMIEDAKDGKFEVILCKSQSRFTRKIETSEKYLNNYFVNWGIRFVTVVDRIDTNDKYNKKFRQINQLINEWYCEDVSESIKSVFNMKQNRGEFIGSFAPYGYMKNREDKNKLEVDSTAAVIIIRIFDGFLEGKPIREIARELNDEGVPSPSDYKKVTGMNYKNSFQSTGCSWSTTTVRRILKNEVYIGNMVQHKRERKYYMNKKIDNLHRNKWITVENTHSPIIDIKSFNKAQSMLKKSRVYDEYDLYGKVYCNECKKKLNIISNGKGYVYLKCMNKIEGKYCSTSFRYKDVDKYIKGEVDLSIEENIYPSEPNRLDKHIIELIDEKGFSFDFIDKVFIGKLDGSVQIKIFWKRDGELNE